MAYNGPPYVTKGEISLGDMALPSYVDVDALIVQAAHDMDASLGRTYVLPLKLQEDDPAHRPIIYLLNKINRYLVMGRIVIDAAVGSEDTQLQAYGNYHIRAAESALKALADGDPLIPGQVLLKPDDSRVTAPLISNRDKVSFVDAFYANDTWFTEINNGGFGNG